MDRIKVFLDKHNIEFTQKMLNMFNIYYENLIEWNSKFNLTAITDRNDVIVKHFLDSITSIKYIDKNSSVIDIGSGAGFPAIPIKIVRPDLKITLLDSLNKRINFLEHIINKLDLTQTIAIHGRAEELSRKSLRESFDVVISRAVARLNTLIEYTIPYIKVNGLFIAYKSKGANIEIKESEKALSELKSEVIANDNFTLEYNNNRCLIIIKKYDKTPICYPRNKNQAKKNPLM